MSFWEKIKQSFRALMTGRNGADRLASNCVWFGLILYILSLVTGLGILVFAALALYVYGMFRMWSRNLEKRRAENRRYVEWRGRLSSRVRQFFKRLKNSREYKYFKCPKCSARLRVKRGSTQTHFTCGRCKEEFDRKA